MSTLHHTNDFWIIPWYCCCIMAMLFILAHIIWRMYCSNSERSKKMKKFHQVTTFICIVAAIISAALSLCTTIYYFTEGIFIFYTPYRRYIVILASFFYYIEIVSLFINISARLHTTFEQVAPQFQISKCALYYIVVLIFLSILSSIAYTILLIFYEHFTYDNFGQVIRVFYAILMVSDVALNVSILCLFIYKLQQIVVNSGL